MSKNAKTFAGSSFLNVRISCFSFSVMKGDEESLGFGLAGYGKL